MWSNVKKLLLISILNVIVVIYCWRSTIYLRQNSTSSNKTEQYLDVNRSRIPHDNKLHTVQNVTYLNESQRIAYCMGRWYKHGVDYHNTTWSTFKLAHGLSRSVVTFSVINETRERVTVPNKDMSNPYKIYLKPFFSFLHLSQSISDQCNDYSLRALVVFGDVSHHDKYNTVPVFVKSRLIKPTVDEHSAILVQHMEYARHWGYACRLYEDIVNGSDHMNIAWDKKLNIVLWRGATTGGMRSNRLPIVRQYFNHSNPNIDIGFNMVVQKGTFPEEVREELQHLIKARQPEREWLRHKYLISLEGNDVASNLNWLLMSNSVVFMAPPTKETWLMEGLLQPYVHYVPLKDTQYKERNNTIWKWNVEEQLEFCLENDNLCHRIAQNSQQFMRKYRFCDKDHEMNVHTKMLGIYCQNDKLSFNRYR